MTSSFLITVQSRLKHGRLYAMVTRYGSFDATQAATGLSKASLFRWVNLRGYPTSAFPGSSFLACRRKRFDAILLKEIGCDCDECWPPEVRQLIDKSAELKSLIFEHTAEVPLTRLTASMEKRLLISSPNEQEVNLEEARHAINGVLSTLTSRERDIIKLHYGIDGPAYTYSEIGNIFHLTKERIRQIEVRAIARIKGSFTLASKLAAVCPWVAEKED